MVLAIQREMLICFMYQGGEDGGQGLISSDGCVRVEENSLEL